MGVEVCSVNVSGNGAHVSQPHCVVGTIYFNPCCVTMVIREYMYSGTLKCGHRRDQSQVSCP